MRRYPAMQTGEGPAGISHARGHRPPGGRTASTADLALDPTECMISGMSEPSSARLRTANRSVAIISPKVPFLEWAQQAYPTATAPPGLPSQSRAYLIPRTDSDQDGRDYIQVECASIFGDMLADWNPDRATWPGNLDSCALFTAWFDVQIVLAVRDMAPDEAITP